MKIIEIELDEVAAEYFKRYGMGPDKPPFSDFVDRVNDPVNIYGESKIQYKIM